MSRMSANPSDVFTEEHKKQLPEYSMQAELQWRYQLLVKAVQPITSLQPQAKRRRVSISPMNLRPQ